LTNFATITSITDNIQTVLKGLGLNFTREVYDDPATVPAGILPHGQIFYKSESFENVYNQRASYAEATFSVRVVLRKGDATALIREQQRWVHTVKDALTVNALNIGDLASSKLVSLVTIERAEAEALGDSIGAVTIDGVLRYREA